MKGFPFRWCSGGRERARVGFLRNTLVDGSGGWRASFSIGKWLFNILRDTQVGGIKGDPVSISIGIFEKHPEWLSVHFYWDGEQVSSLVIRLFNILRNTLVDGIEGDLVSISVGQWRCVTSLQWQSHNPFPHWLQCKTVMQHCHTVTLIAE